MKSNDADRFWMTYLELVYMHAISQTANAIGFYGDAFDRLLTYLDWGVMFTDFVDAFVIILAILFTGATLEIFVKKTFK